MSGRRRASLLDIVAVALVLAMASAGLIGSGTAGADNTLVVAQDGSGSHATIAEAVAAAQAGDTVLVRPGTYTEAVTIEVDISLRGEGRREDIVIVAPDRAPAPVSGHLGDEHETCALFLRATHATISDLSVRGEASVVVAREGAPTLTRLLFDSVGITETSPDDGSDGASIVIDGGSSAVVRDNELAGGGPIAVYEGSTPLIEANRLTGGPRIFGVFGDAAVIRGNAIADTPARPSIILWEGAEMLVEGNTIVHAGREGIGVRAGSPTIRGNMISGATTDGILMREADAAPVIVDNVIEDVGQVGISVAGGTPRLEGNTISRAAFFGISVTGTSAAGEPVVIVGNALRDNGTAIAWNAPEGMIADNDVTGGRDGILIAVGSPAVTGNRIEDVEGRAIFVAAGASPTLSGNATCGNGEDIVLAAGAITEHR